MEKKNRILQAELTKCQGLQNELDEQKELIAIYEKCNAGLFAENGMLQAELTKCQELMKLREARLKSLNDKYSAAVEEIMKLDSQLRIAKKILDDNNLTDSYEIALELKR